jgi:hypothetical protein
LKEDTLMKKLHPQSTLPVLFIFAALIMTFGGKRLAAIGEQISTPVLVFEQKTRGADGGNLQAVSVEDPEEHDLGDAPDSSNSFPGASMLAYPITGVVANYPTIYWTGFPPYGPIHWQPKARIHLGNSVTSESRADHGYDEDIKNNLDPTGDLSDQDGGDDGVQLPLVLPHCQEATFDYTVTAVSSIYSSAYVNVWCDWNRDGDWDDTLICTRGQAPEWTVQNQQLLFTGPGTFNITTPRFMCWHPETKGELDPMWMRITISLQPWETGPGAAVPVGGSGPAVGYEYGETEDYFIYPRKEIGPDEYDWGDAPDSAAAAGYPTLATNNGASHVIAGPWLGDDYDQPDSESDGQPDTNALGDNNYDKDDENGATIPALIRGETADITLDVRGGGGIVQVWIDFNGDKTWQGAEKIFDNFKANGAHTITCPVPSSAVLGQTFARFRISKQGGLGPEGPAPDGEVEDYEVFIEEKAKGSKLVQWPDLTRNGIDICVGRADGKYRSLADDFECTNNNRITTISLWGSWKNDNKGAIKQIHLSIYSDDPTGPEGKERDNEFSKPGFWRWGRDFGPNEFQETLYHVVREPGEWWWDPVSEEYGPGGDSEIWRTDIYINPDEAFLQEGSPDNPVIYWLEVQVDTEDGDFGWKTRQWPDHYMDDAVFWSCKSQPCAWRELRYPKTHPYHNLEENSIDMAFQLTYTDEGPDQPTSRPVSPTQCPAVQTRCPAVDTECHAAETKCPSVMTKCPPTSTICQGGQTQCPAVETKCPLTETRCPSVMTSCPPTSTVCQGGQTQCPTVYTQCPAELTECPSSDTSCPSMYTYCPEDYTFCPAQQTKCPSVSTECPPVSTRCPAVNTQCPTVNTECPPVPTECPAVDTECPPVATDCPAVDTECPAVPTNCPAIDTECPPEPTNCPEEYTECPVVSTRCPAVHTSCPKTMTSCQQQDTICPQDPTRCPAMLTWCFQVPTECPMADTLCPETHTQCPPVDTQCPLTESVCVCIIETFQPGCPRPLTVFPLCRDGTKNFSAAVLGNCPAIDVQSPTVVPEYLLTKAR